jgi:hypothetical protein
MCHVMLRGSEPAFHMHRQTIPKATQAGDQMPPMADGTDHKGCWERQDMNDPAKNSDWSARPALV